MSTFTHLADRLAAAIGDVVHRANGGERGLADLDDRMLADLGVSRSEIASIEAEAHGASPSTRLRIVLEMRHA